MQIDQDLAVAADPPWSNELQMHTELWTLMRITARNWPLDPPSEASFSPGGRRRKISAHAVTQGGRTYGYLDEAKAQFRASWEAFKSYEQEPRRAL
jgi:hypothetical protein